MKFIQVLSRLSLLSLAAAAFAGLTEIYGGSVRPPLPHPQWRAGRLHRPSAPEVGKFPELIGEGMVVAIYAVGGRIVFRLRLSPVSRSEGQPIFVGIASGSKDCQIMVDPEVGPRHSAIDPGQ
jgi:hypothetical protein